MMSVGGLNFIGCGWLLQRAGLALAVCAVEVDGTGADQRLHCSFLHVLATQNA